MKQLEDKTRNNCKVAWVDAGEGQNGPYNPDDPEDMKLLCFESWALVDEKWLPIKHGSQRTQVGAQESKEMRETLLDKLLDRIEPKVEAAISAGVATEKGELVIEGGTEFFEKLSWFGPEMAEEY